MSAQRTIGGRRAVALGLSVLPLAATMTLTAPAQAATPAQPAVSAQRAAATQASAQAAYGTLIINGVRYRNPHGCFRTWQRPLRVLNHTNRPAIIKTGYFCQGGIDRIVRPGQFAISFRGHSVYIR